MREEGRQRGGGRERRREEGRREKSKALKEREIQLVLDMRLDAGDGKGTQSSTLVPSSNLLPSVSH